MFCGACNGPYEREFVTSCTPTPGGFASPAPKPPKRSTPNCCDQLHFRTSSVQAPQPAELPRDGLVTYQPDYWGASQSICYNWMQAVAAVEFAYRVLLANRDIYIRTACHELRAIADVDITTTRTSGQTGSDLTQCLCDIFDNPGDSIFFIVLPSGVCPTFSRCPETDMSTTPYGMATSTSGSADAFTDGSTVYLFIGCVPNDVGNQTTQSVLSVALEHDGTHLCKEVFDLVALIGHEILHSCKYSHGGRATEREFNQFEQAFRDALHDRYLYYDV